MSALHGPLGSLRGLPSPATAQLAPLRQCSPLLRTRLRFSAMQKAALDLLSLPCLLLSFPQGLSKNPVLLSSRTKKKGKTLDPRSGRG